jgi:hypothetical protein
MNAPQNAHIRSLGDTQALRNPRLALKARPSSSVDLCKVRSRRYRRSRSPPWQHLFRHHTNTSWRLRTYLAHFCDESLPTNIAFPTLAPTTSGDSASTYMELIQFTYMTTLFAAEMCIASTTAQHVQLIQKICTGCRPTHRTS